MQMKIFVSPALVSDINIWPVINKGTESRCGWAADPQEPCAVGQLPTRLRSAER